MIKMITDDDKPDAPHFELSDSERTALMGIAIRKAVLWGAVAAVLMSGGNLMIYWATDTAIEPLWITGLSWFLLVSILVFFWKRHTLLRRSRMMLDQRATQLRHEITADKQHAEDTRKSE